jgi:hypothetical protein
MSDLASLLEITDGVTAPAYIKELSARMQQTLDHAQATGPNPTSQRALEYRLAQAINALAFWLAHPPAASMGSVTVKALEWEAYGGRWRASSPGITVLKYIVNPDKWGDYYVSVNGHPLTKKYPSSDGAKAAAQSHFAAAIFAALDSPPDHGGGEGYRRPRRAPLRAVTSARS